MAGKSSSLMDLISQLDESTVQAQVDFYRANKDAVAIYVDDSNSEFVERSMEISSKICQYSYDCSRNVRELNALLPKGQQFFPVNILPRDPRILIMGMESVYFRFNMDATSPTTRRCKRFTHQLYKEYVASTMLQVFSLRFTGVDQQPLPIYGFVAARDDCEPLRNYIFNLSREEAFNLSPDSPLLPLISPSRGISVWNNALIEVNLKVKNIDNNQDDDVISDVCINFRWDRIERGKRLKSRIDGPFGTLYMDYMFIKHGVEAVVEVDIPKEFIGDHVLIIARSTWFKDDMIIYDAVVPEENPTVSVVIAASEGGRLFLGFLAMGARVCDCVSFKVKKFGCQSDCVPVYPQPKPQPKPIKFDVLSQSSPFVRRSFPAMSRFAWSNATIAPFLVRFKVTYSTMGYYNCGM